MTYAKQGGLYWSHPTPEALEAVSKWDIVILNEANLYSHPDQPAAKFFARNIKALNPLCKVLVSFNAFSVFVGPDGKPSVYFPIQCKIHALAEKHNAWLMVNGQHVTASPNTWLFDIRNYNFRNELAALINAYFISEPDYYFLDGVHFDELHRTIRFLPNADQLPLDAEWQLATNSFLKKISYPIMGNGTYDLTKYHKTKSRGRYLQNVTDITQMLLDLKYDLELPIRQRWTTINPIGNINKNAFAKVSYATGLNIQYYPGGPIGNFQSYNIERLSF